ncbi:WD40 repeat domain-containing protein [Stigmatella sp. ncwal1]|uniref:WD40 repeat domain-containing protein n=1 Tax=Stigmatella ashevillensis TaxID=2995309 RepID=A0ABT5DAI1_9BACT|nr:WD40 repeat domain-containing protein [Stigmatella ashevillena]MDC0709833.1 WD40 repeat domain-containing protein [Stigmatella ashevillena]
MNKHLLRLMMLSSALVLMTGRGAHAEPRRRVIPIEYDFVAVSFSPDERSLAILSESSITLYDVATGKKGRTLELKSDSLSSPGTFSPNGQMFAAACSVMRSTLVEQVCIWRTSTGKTLPAWGGTPDPLKADDIAFAPNGKELVTSADGDITVSHLNLDKERTFPGQAFGLPLKGGWIAVAHQDGPISVNLLATGKPLRTLEGTNPATEFTVDSQGKWIAGWVGGSAITLYNAATGARSGEVSPGPMALSSIAFLASGRQLATVDAGQVRFWAVPSGQLTATLPYDGELLALSPQGRWLVTRKPQQPELHLIPATATPPLP